MATTLLVVMVTIGLVVHSNCNPVNQFANIQDALLSGTSQGHASLQNLMQYADKSISDKLEFIHTRPDNSLMDRGSFRHKRSATETQETLNELQTDMYELQAIIEVLSIPVDYPNDVETISYNEEVYIIITHASDTSNPTYRDEVHIYHFDNQTLSIELILTQTSPGVQDVDYFIYDGLYYVVVAQAGDENSKKAGVFTYLWNIDQPANSQTFFKVQKLKTIEPTIVETLEAGGTQFIIVAERPHMIMNVEAVVMYEWKGGHMDEFAVFPKDNLVSLIPFCVFSRIFLGIASSSDANGNPVTDSEILLYNLHLHKFESFQTIATHGALDMEFFTFGSGMYTESFLLIANTFDERGRTPKSVIYKYHDTRFVPFQCFEVEDMIGWFVIVNENKGFVSLIVYTSTSTTFYEYDGWRFQESSVQFNVSSLGIPVNKISVVYSDYRADLILASNTTQAEMKPGFFKLQFGPVNIVTNFDDQAEDVCNNSKTVYETVRNVHLNIVVKIPDTVYIDFGNFTLNSNSSLLNGLKADDVKINEVKVLDDQVLTNAEETQLQGIKEKKTANSASLTSLRTLLPDTVLLDTDPQVITGQKTFASFEAEGTLTPSKLTVTSDLANTNINIQNMYDEFINVSTDVVYISIAITFDGGIDVTGELNTTGTVDDVDMTEIVTLSRNHTITGRKAFMGGLTAGDDITVEGTVDGVTVTTTTILQTSGTQEVTGSYSFEAETTVSDNVVVTGNVDGVDLSELKDEAVYLAGDHNVTGPMTFEGAVTMGAGLKVADGKTVDGVDVEDLYNGILRLTKAQNVSAEYTFTKPLKVEGDITTQGTVDKLYIPDDIVLIDDPNPVSVTGPLQFADDVTLKSLTLRDHINNINALESYVDLDLLLTIPKNTKNIQRVTGQVVFAGDIYIENTTFVVDKVDGVDIKALASDTVFNFGDQMITGSKTFEQDLTIEANLTVNQKLDKVDINDLDDNAIKLSSGVLGSLGNLKFSGFVTCSSSVSTNGSHTFGSSTTLSDLVTQGTTEDIGGQKSFISVTSNDNIQVTSKINEVPIDTLYRDALRLDDSAEVTVTGSWEFSNNVNIAGSLSVTGDIDGIDLDDAVTLIGDQTITGDTSFLQTVSADTSIDIGGNLVLSGELNTKDVQVVNTDTLMCSGTQTITGSKTFESLSLSGNLVITGTIRDIDVSDMNDNAVFITGDQDITGAKKFSVAPSFKDVDFDSTVNGISVPAFFSTVLTQYTEQTIEGGVSSVDIDVGGDLTVSDTINELVVEDMWTHSAKITDDTYTVTLTLGDVESNDDVTVNGAVDGVMIARDVALANTAAQVFTGTKSFQGDQSFGANITVEVINTVNILNLWNTAVKIEGDQTLTHGKTFTNGITINGNLSVTGTVDGVDVSDLAARAVVTSDKPGAVQTITAAVTLSDVTAEDNITYSGLLQTVNIQTLDSSYFSRSADPQTITGSKKYSGTVTIATGANITVSSLDLEGLLNTHDMDTLYEAVWLVNGGDTVYDVKKFQQCVTIKGDLSVDRTIDGVDISANAMVTNKNQLVSGFKVFSSDLKIVGQNLNFEDTITIDNVDVSDWSANAVLKASGYTIDVDLEFASIHFEEDVSVTGHCSGLNFTTSNFMTISRDQEVTAVKTFLFGVQFTGNMTATGTVQGADVEVIESNSLLTYSDQTIKGTLVIETVPTFTNITTSAYIDGEDVVDLYLRTHNTPDLDDFDDFLDGQCDLLDGMHDAFQNQAFILRYPLLVQTMETNGRGKIRGYYFDGTQWLVQAMGSPVEDSEDTECQDSFIYRWNDTTDSYELFQTLHLQYIHDIAFFNHEGWMFLAVITSNPPKGCEDLNFLPNKKPPLRSVTFSVDVIPSAFTGITNRWILIYVWCPILNEFYIYQRLAGVGSLAVDTYVDPIINQPCLAVANHWAVISGNVTSEIESALYCMEHVESGFDHNNVIDTLGAVKIHPFLYDDILHLAVANRLDTSERTFMVESAIWGNFVKEVVITTTAAADVAVKEFHGTYYVAFANEFEGQLEWEDYDVPVSVYTYVYDAEDESEVDLWQEIPAFRVVSLEFVEIHDQLFLMVINRTSSVNIFRYEGMQKFQVIHTIPVEGAIYLSVYPFKDDPDNIHIAAMAYGEQPTLFANSQVRTRTVSSPILQLFFDGYKTDTTGCTRP